MIHLVFFLFVSAMKIFFKDGNLARACNQAGDSHRDGLLPRLWGQPHRQVLLVRQEVCAGLEREAGQAGRAMRGCLGKKGTHGARSIQVKVHYLVQGLHLLLQDARDVADQGPLASRPNFAIELHQETLDGGPTGAMDLSVPVGPPESATEAG